MATVTTSEPKVPALPTPAQWLVLVLPLALLAALAAGLLLLKPDYVSLLWSTPPGVRMVAGTGALLILGAGLFLGGCVFINRFAQKGTVAPVASVLLALVWLVVFCAPAACVLAVGPAAIQIQKSLQAN